MAHTIQKKHALQIFVLSSFVLCIVLAYLFNIQDYLNFETLKHHRHQVLKLVSMHYGFSVMIFILVYIALVTLSFPGATFMSITGGFLFGLLGGVVYVVLGATIGATFLFLLAHFVFADLAKEKAGPWLRNLKKGFKKNALHYLLFLRLVPLMPFFIVNLAAAVLDVPLRIYVLGTFLGIIPAAVVYVCVGTGLGSIFDRGETFTGKGLLTPEMVIALCGLAFLSILPVIYKKIKKKELL